MYALRDDDLFLIPTAEVPVTNLYRDEILDGADLPKGFCALHAVLSPRGGRGRQGHARRAARARIRQGRARSLRDARESSMRRARAADRATRRRCCSAWSFRIASSLLAAGDTGFASAKTYDLEAWAPGVGAWLEVSSCSTFTDFQARRANIRYRPAQGREAALRAHAQRVGARVSAHDRVRSSSTTSSRTAASTVPEVLRPYLGHRPARLSRAPARSGYARDCRCRRAACSGTSSTRSASFASCGARRRASA